MDPITIAQLLTVPGAIIAVLLIVQVVKPMLPKVNTRLMVLILSLLIVITANVLVGAVTPTEIFLAVLSAFSVTVGAMGAYDTTFKKLDDAKKVDEGGVASGGDKP
jgi:hypothetical protein